MKKYLIAAAAMAALMSGSYASAGLADLKKLGKQASPDASGASQETIVQNFAHALGTVMQGQAELHEAFNNKDKAAELRSTAEALTGGSTVEKGDIEKARALSAEAQASSQEKIAAGAELSDEGRVHYLNGLVLSAQGVSETKALAKDAANFSTSARQQISSASMIQKAKVTRKLAAGMYVVKAVPGFTSELVKNFGLLVTFAKSANIPVPEDATDLLAAL